MSCNVRFWDMVNNPAQFIPPRVPFQLFLLANNWEAARPMAPPSRFDNLKPDGSIADALKLYLRGMLLSFDGTEVNNSIGVTEWYNGPLESPSDRHVKVTLRTKEFRPLLEVQTTPAERFACLFQITKTVRPFSFFFFFVFLK